MAGPTKKSLPSAPTPEELLNFVEQLRLRAETFHGTLQEELRRVLAGIDQERVRRAKRRGQGRRKD